MANIFNGYFTAIADGIGFSDLMPVGYEDDAVLKTMIVKYDDHLSIIAIKSLCRRVILLYSLISQRKTHMISL